jgi:hypothetical protein
MRCGVTGSAQPLDVERVVVAVVMMSVQPATAPVGDRCATPLARACGDQVTAMHRSGDREARGPSLGTDDAHRDHRHRFGLPAATQAS